MKRKELSFRTAVGMTRCIETVAETPGKNRKNFGQEVNRCLPIKFDRIPLARKRKEISEETRRKS